MRHARIGPAVSATILIACFAGRAQTPSPIAAANSAAASAPVELDHVVAIIGSNVILQSDVQQEMHLSALEPLQVLPGQNTPDRALRRLVNRTLILEQMKEQQQPVAADAAEVDKALDELRRQIPACARYHCETEQGWDAFLKANELTRAMVEQRWSQRTAMLHFVDLRFRSGLHISPDQISTYYHKTLVPALEKNHETPPPLSNVAGRVQEILLQQQVSGLFQDWLSSLRDQGNVQVVDPSYQVQLNSKDEESSQ